MSPAAGSAPRIVVTLRSRPRQTDPDIAARKNALYLDGVGRHGAVAVPLDATASAAERESAFASMDGLLLSGGADVDPARYGQAVDGAHGDGARARRARGGGVGGRRGAGALPVLGICRGFQAMNVFAGGTLLQHVDGHAGPGWGNGHALTHPLRIAPGRGSPGSCSRPTSAAAS